MSHDMKKNEISLPKSRERSTKLVGQAIQMLTSYYATNGCILSNEMANKVEQVIEERFDLGSKTQD